MDRESVVLTYGSVGRRPWRRIAALLALVAFAHALGWWVGPRWRQWNEDRVRRAQIRDQIETNLDESGRAIAHGDWMAAEISIDRARLANDADPTIFGAPEIARQRVRIERAESRLGAAREDARRRALADPATAALVQRRIRNPIVCGSTNVITDLTRTAQTLLRDERYSEAAATLSQILILDPENTRASDLLANALYEVPARADQLVEGENGSEEDRVSTSER